MNPLVLCTTITLIFCNIFFCAVTIINWNTPYVWIGVPFIIALLYFDYIYLNWAIPTIKNRLKNKKIKNSSNK